MRTTLAIDDDVLSVARKMALSQNRTLGEVVSCLARRGLNLVEAGRQTRNGVPLLPVRPGSARVTSDLVYQLCKELH